MPTTNTFSLWGGFINHPLIQTGREQLPGWIIWIMGMGGSKVFWKIILKYSIPCSIKHRRGGVLIGLQVHKTFNSAEHQYLFTSTSVSRSVMFDSLWPHGQQPTRLLCPWDFPSKDPGMVCHFLLQGIFLTFLSIPGLNPGLLLADSSPTELPGKPHLFTYSD